MTLPSNATNSGELASKSNELTRTDEFLALFEADRRRIYAYIYAYVMDKSAADDIFQETSMILWREFEKFEPNSNFSKWANGIVFNRVRVYRRVNKHFSLGLSEARMDELFQSTDVTDDPDNRWQLLQSCRAQLNDSDQKLYHAFYINNQKANDIAKQSGRSIFGIRKSIHRLRKKLFDCVDHKKREGLA